MRKSILLLSFVVAAATVVLGQAPKPKAAEAASAEEALKQLEQQWTDALVKADTAFLDRLLAPDFLSTQEDGQVLTKEQAMARLKSGELKFQSATINELKVRMFGDVGIVHGLSTGKLTQKGKDESGQYRWTDIFVKRGGRWQAVATHVSKVTAR